MERFGTTSLMCSSILVCQGRLHAQKVAIVPSCMDTGSLWSPRVVVDPDSGLPAPAGVPDSQRAVWVHQWLPPRVLCGEACRCTLPANNGFP